MHPAGHTRDYRRIICWRCLLATNFASRACAWGRAAL